MRIRSSSSDRKNFERPGSPWRPERPRSWLSMRRLSWRSVPSTNRPPAASAFSFSRATCVADLGGARVALGRRRRSSVELLADAHVGVAAELDVGAAAGHVGGDGDRARHAGLGDDVGFLLVVARVEDGEHLGLLGALVAGIERRERVRVGEVVLLPALPCAASRRAARTSRSRWCRPGPAGRVDLAVLDQRDDRAVFLGGGAIDLVVLVDRGSSAGWSGPRPRRGCRCRRTRRLRSAPCRSCRRASRTCGSSSGR